MPEPIALWPGKTESFAGRSIFVRRDRPPGSSAAAGAPRERAVYVHGLGGASTNWTDLMGALCSDVAGEAPDLPGFGQSPPPDDGAYGLDAQAAVVIDLIEAGPYPVHLLGNSMGGAVAVRVAASSPHLVRSLSLLSPALPDLWPRLIPYQMTGALIPFLGPAVYARMQSRPPEVRLQDTLNTTYFDPSATHARRIDEALEAERERENHGHAHTAVLESLRSLVAEYVRRGAHSLWRQAARVHSPTLLVFGFNDRFVNPLIARRAARTFPRNRVVMMPETGHLPMMEHPMRVSRLVRPFLLEHSGGGPRPRR
ncbi:alpha/beta fold hydrolase [Nocardiopsis mangrovi]|uniref:Alpha/beta fold hydrolase n=1 Tax=Nocardiopsis mangrovi TaxID=1179818 RepID=A0ABV9DPY9_9ACTN